MPLNLDLVPVSAKLHYASLGRQFGCEDTLMQADQTLASADLFAGVIGEHGFVREDIDRLRDVRDLLAARASGQSEQRAREKRTSQSYVDAMRAGKTARQRARSILHIVAQRLAHSGDAIEAEAARAVSAALQQTESSRGEPIRLASQLDQLRGALSMPRVEKAAAPRGGPDALRELAQTAEALRLAAMLETPRHDGVASDVARDLVIDELDLLCGMIVELVRDARRAARSAARAARNPVVASAFELVKLYGPLGGGAADSDRCAAPR